MTAVWLERTFWNSNIYSSFQVCKVKSAKIRDDTVISPLLNELVFMHPADGGCGISRHHTREQHVLAYAFRHGLRFVEEPQAPLLAGFCRREVNTVSQCLPILHFWKCGSIWSQNTPLTKIITKVLNVSFFVLTILHLRASCSRFHVITPAGDSASGLIYVL